MVVESLEVSLTFMNKLWSDTTWIMDKIEPEVVDVGLLGQLDLCVHARECHRIRRRTRVWMSRVKPLNKPVP